MKNENKHNELEQKEIRDFLAEEHQKNRDVFLPSEIEEKIKELQNQLDKATTISRLRIYPLLMKSSSSNFPRMIYTHKYDLGGVIAQFV